MPGVQTCALPICIRQAFNRARRFFAFARERLGRLDVSRIDQALVDAYARHLRADPARRPVIVGHLLEVVPDLYHYRDHLRSEEHTSELQSLMRISYAVFCLNKKQRNYDIELGRNKV